MTDLAIEILREFGLVVFVALVLLVAFGYITKKLLDSHLALIRTLQKNADQQTKLLAQIAATQSEIVALLREKQPCTHVSRETRNAT